MLTAEKLRELLYYNPETGIFTWKVTLSNRAVAGTPAGGRDGRCGYITIRIGGKLYMSHRLAWLYMTGAWPKSLIDHINRQPNDNRFANLREATPAQNRRNEHTRKDNTSGFRGVYWCKVHLRWVARTRIDGRQKVLGYFSDINDAAAAYRAAVLPIAGEFAHFDRLPTGDE